MHRTDTIKRTRETSLQTSPQAIERHSQGFLHGSLSGEKAPMRSAPLPSERMTDRPTDRRTGHKMTTTTITARYTDNPPRGPQSLRRDLGAKSKTGPIGLGFRRNKMRPFDRKVLESIATAIRTAEQELDLPRGKCKTRFGWSGRRELSEGFGIRLSYCAWSGLDRPNESTAKKWQRTVIRLENAGFVERVSLPANDRPTHIRLTAKGRQSVELESLAAF